MNPSPKFRSGAICFLMVSIFGALPVAAQNTWMNPFTGNSFNNPMSRKIEPPSSYFFNLF